jgi:hypothetical protein
MAEEEFGRWVVNSLAITRVCFVGLATITIRMVVRIIAKEVVRLD